MGFYVRYTLMSALIFCMVILTACGGGSDTTDSQVVNSDQGPEQEVYKISLGHNATEDRAIGKAAAAFKEEVENLTDGQIIVDIYPNSQLGSTSEQVEQVHSNAIQMTIQGASVYSQFTQDLQVLDLPFLWTSNDELWEMMSGEVGRDILDTLDGSGLKGIALWSLGFKSMTSNNGPINEPGDLEGLKFRVMPSPLNLAIYSEWGANPVSVDLVELYNALQQGIADAQDNPLESIYTRSYFEVQDYLSLTNHSHLGYVFSANEDWFNELPSDLQEAVLQAGLKSTEVHHDLRISEEEEMLQGLIDNGMEVNEITDEGRQKFMDTVQVIYDEFIVSDAQKAIFEKIMANR